MLVACHSLHVSLDILISLSLSRCVAQAHNLVSTCIRLGFKGCIGSTNPEQVYTLMQLKLSDKVPLPNCGPARAALLRLHHKSPQ